MYVCMYVCVKIFLYLCMLQEIDYYYKSDKSLVLKSDLPFVDLRHHALHGPWTHSVQLEEIVYVLI